MRSSGTPRLENINVWNLRLELARPTFHQKRPTIHQKKVWIARPQRNAQERTNVITKICYCAFRFLRAVGWKPQGCSTLDTRMGSKIEKKKVRILVFHGNRYRSIPEAMCSPTDWDTPFEALSYPSMERGNSILILAPNRVSLGRASMPETMRSMLLERTRREWKIIWLIVCSVWNRFGDQSSHIWRRLFSHIQKFHLQRLTNCSGKEMKSRTTRK